MCHREAYKEFSTSAGLKLVDEVGTLSQTAITDVFRDGKETKEGRLYSLNHPQQKLFDKKLLSWIVIDSLPFDTPKGIGFQNLVKHFDPRLRIAHPTTIKRRMESAFTEVLCKNI